MISENHITNEINGGDKFQQKWWLENSDLSNFHSGPYKHV